MKESDRRVYEASFKSIDTEEFIDLWFYRPIGFHCALFFRNRGIHPNVVTLLSIFLGIAAGICFMQSQLQWNILGMLLLIWANLYDSADGQLARLTGKKTRWGRILDGFAGDVWFACIYIAIAIRETAQPIPFMPQEEWGISIWILCSLAGLWVHGSQSQLADYYRNIHLYFLKGTKGSELDNAVQQRKIYRETPWKGNFFWKIFLSAYVAYTKNQEDMSPRFQELIGKIKENYGDSLPPSLQQYFRKKSLPLLKYTNILTFNTRSIVFWYCLLIGQLWFYLFFELVLLNILFFYMRARHEKICKQLIQQIESGYDFRKSNTL